jgi:hypothetical protein
MVPAGRLEDRLTISKNNLAVGPGYFSRLRRCERLGNDKPYRVRLGRLANSLSRKRFN